MRVESESNQAAQPHWQQNIPPDASRAAEQQWQQSDEHLAPPSVGDHPPSEHPPSEDVSQPQSPFPIQVDPALNGPAMPPTEEMNTTDQSPFTLQPAYVAPHPPTRSQRTRGNHGTNVSSRARTDLLSPNAAALFRAATSQASGNGSPPSPSSPTSAANGNGVPRLPPILQVEKQTVTTTATQAASASRRRNEAMYQCPVPGCGSTFTRRFNLRGHLRSHTEERPYVCEWPGCGKGFARQHDCKRHYALHSPRQTSSHVCQGCGKSFSRTDALNRHLRSDNGAECRAMHASFVQNQNQHTVPNPTMLIPGMDINGLPGPHTKFNGGSNGSLSPAAAHSPMPAA